MTFSRRSSMFPRLTTLALTGWLASGLLGCTGPQGSTGSQGDTGATGPAGPTAPPRLLDDKVGHWLPANRDRINTLLRTAGLSSTTYDPKNRPVAVFDWDNTVVKNDLGDATFFWMLQHDKLHQPAGRNWSNTSNGLTAAGRSALNTACDAAGDPGQPLLTSTYPDCADELFSIYDGAKTRGGLAAWTQTLTLTNNAPYAWVAQLMAGYTPEEIHAIAQSAYAENAFNPPGTTQTVGTNTVAYHVRVYDEMTDLVETLQANGFDVWVVSASSQYVIEAVSEQLIGVKPAHVVGIRSLTDSKGALTAHLQGCGTVADGADTLITFDQGKRCWINKAIFQLPVDQQLVRQTDVKKRQVFSAGDSDTDIAFVQDASQLKLVLNRGKVQLMCNAYANANNTWLVQPMFVLPRAKASAPYPCTTAVDAVGNPIVDELGNRFTQNYEDTVYQLP